MLVEEALKLFVGDIDTQLLEAVVGEVLETVDVENADGRVNLQVTANTRNVTSCYTYKA